MAHSVDVMRTTMSAVSVPTSSSSSSSDGEIVYGERQSQTSLQSRGRRHYQKQDKSWNYPRKTIKTIDSMGRIEGRTNLKEASKSSKRIVPLKVILPRASRVARNQTSSRRGQDGKLAKSKKVKGHVNRYKRLLELAKPKSAIASNGMDDSSTYFKEAQSIRKKHHGPRKRRSNSAVKKSNREQISGCKTIAKMNTLPMVYRTTEHTAKLAEPRDRNEVGVRLLGRVLESALFAQASKRLVELATPRKVGLNIRNENVAARTAYGVSNEALKAVCSPRILQLSVPRNPKNLLKITNNKKNTEKLNLNK